MPHNDAGGQARRDSRGKAVRHCKHLTQPDIYAAPGRRPGRIRGYKLANRSVHYEAAFEDYLRAKGLPYVAVDEARKAIFADVTIKSFDFLVYSNSGPNLLVDVKGRRFPGRVLHGGPRRGPKAWENWITRQDVEGLALWRDVFGGGFAPVLVFAYMLMGSPSGGPFSDVHIFRDSAYAFVCVGLNEYVEAARPRSAKWSTITVSSAVFAGMARPVEDFLGL